MNPSSHRPFRRSGFTLLEMLVAVAVLVILLLALGQMFNIVSGSIEKSGGHMSSDGEARMVFDRLANDLEHMPKRYDIDYTFISQAPFTSQPPNECNEGFFFYSEAPAFLATGAPSTVQNSAALIGYQINAGYQLERLGYALNWDQAGWSMNHLTFPNVATTFTPDPMSTINDGGNGQNNGSGQGQWSSVMFNDGATSNYHILADSVFRLEFCFLLKDGTYSTSPVLNATPSTWPTSGTPPKFYVSQTGPPAPSNGSTTYAAGSRWWDSTNNRAWICLQAPSGSPPGAAVWRPLGWGDVAGVVVALALLDDGSRAILTAQGKNLSQAATQLLPPTQSDLTASAPQLMSTTWQQTVNSSSFPSAAGLPASVAGQVRIYQRCIYLNNTTNL